MHWSKVFTVVGAHAEGEIGRVVTAGVLHEPGLSMLDRLNWLNKDADHIRRFCLFEPRGAAQMTVNLLTPPSTPEADAGFIPMQGDGSHAMSGSNAMCVTTVLLETGMLKMTEPETVVRLDTAAGLVKATAKCRDGRVQSVTLDFLSSFAEALDCVVDVPGLGSVKLDVAFGGVYYVLADIGQFDLEIAPDNAKKMVELGNRIKRASKEQLSVQHPTIEQFDDIEFCMFTDVEDAQNKVYRNATIMPPGRVDRSPCGTGTAARLAVMSARGEVEMNECVTMRSTIGSRFKAQVSGNVEIGNLTGVTTRITGRAWIYGIHQLGVDPTDPFPMGFTMADTWGDGIEHHLPEL
ncbi:MAG: proline racemase [Rhodobacteraceae bacterium]|nr:proline racemase [Paracoccaceae bacterium]